MEEFIVCRMSEEDLPEVAAIDKRLFSTPWSVASFKSAIDNPDNIFLSCKSTESGEVIAYVGIYISLDEGNITNVAVDERYRRLGIAKKLLEEIEKIAVKTDVKTLYLEVRESNLPAISLYKKCDFREVGIRKNYYEKPIENAYIMIKRIV